MGRVDPTSKVPARYVLPAGLVELVRREAVRSACSPSVVLSDLILDGLPRRAARLVAEQAARAMSPDVLVEVIAFADRAVDLGAVP